MPILAVSRPPEPSWFLSWITTTASPSLVYFNTPFGVTLLKTHAQHLTMLSPSHSEGMTGKSPDHLCGPPTSPAMLQPHWKSPGTLPPQALALLVDCGRIALPSIILGYLPNTCKSSSNITFSMRPSLTALSNLQNFSAPCTLNLHYLVLLFCFCILTPFSFKHLSNFSYGPIPLLKSKLLEVKSLGLHCF